MAEEKKEIKAQEKIKEIKKRLAEIEEKAERLEIPGQGIGLKINLKNGFEKITEILNKMLRGNIKEYQEIETKKIGEFKVEKGLRMSFLDEALGDDEVKVGEVKKKKNKEKDE